MASLSATSHQEGRTLDLGKGSFMIASYNYFLVAVSLLVAMLSSYTTLDLASRIHSLQAAGARRIVWLLGGAAVMGTGIWSMHFIGMLAFRMPMAFTYDLGLTLVSLLIAVLLSFFALLVVSKQRVGGFHLVLGSLGMGLAIAAMHYTGMAALRMQAVLTYNPWLVVLSIAIAVVASGTALWIASRLWGDDQRLVTIKRCGAGLILGFAIAGMHYTGMSAAHFSTHAAPRVVNAVNINLLAAIVASSTLILLVSTLIFSRMDRGYDTLAGRMEASLEDAHQQLVVMATQDALTELPNRGSLLQRMKEMIVRSAHTGRPFTVMFADLDGFKTINDSLGHAAGDSLLIEFSRHLRNSVRQDDMVGRMGGDEFVVLLDGLGIQDDLVPIAKGILQRMQQDFNVGGTPLRVTASIGLASYPTDGMVAEDLLRSADMAMYDAKQGGKNTYRFYDVEMSRAASRTLFIYRALSEAFAKNQMSLHFQPKFSGPTQELVGAEALIRWCHPEMGDIPPRQFIPIAERTGQIMTAGNWVIAQVCRHINQWDLDGLPPIKIAINLSPEQLCAPRYIETVLEILEAASVPPSRIMFEITETAAMRNADLSAQVLRQFKMAGFDISIDDFGTGYSSLAYLQHFRVNQLKIDRFFIQGLDNEDDGGRAIVAAIIAVAHSLDMVVVAEGVETATQLAALKALQCDELQGFFLAKPQDAAAFEAFLRVSTVAMPAVA
jgi:diguanylate cyclase (GGDEF)-like protein